MDFGTRIVLVAGWLMFTTAVAVAQPDVSVNDAEVVEGNSGTTNAEFVITLSAPWTNAITVAFNTHELPYDFFNQPYPARSGVDFIATNGTVTFGPGETNKSVFVQVIGDTINEANEPFGFSVSVQGQSGEYDARGTILDDDPLEIFVNSVAAVEGAASDFTSVPVTMTTYETTEQVVYGELSPNGGTGTPGTDYPTMPSTWELDPGPPRTNVSCCTIGIYGDNTNEDDETFFLNPNLGFGRFNVRPKDINPQNARGVVFVNQPTCTIINDDFYFDLQPLANDRSQVTLHGAFGATHVLQSSSDLVTWTSFSTNTLDSSRQVSVTVTNNGKLFYRALRTVSVSQ